MKFYADVEMYANNFNGTDPEAYMANWTLRRRSPSPENQWQGNNMPALQCSSRVRRALRRKHVSSTGFAQGARASWPRR